MLFGRLENITIPNVFDRQPEIVEVIKEVAIPESMFRKLVMLCHPDKHGNSELSQDVTRWLLDQRTKK